ncbi:MAG: thioredoxin domain-containing protein [Candidatus Gracilibacteria bacterium]
MWAGAVLIVLIAVFGIYKAATYDSTAGLTVSAISSTDWTKGTPGKPVLIEYSDFQCPACAAYYPVVKQVVSEYSGRIQFSYRHFPLYELHKNALESSYAAQASGKQGKFWEMHDKLFERQKDWSDLDDPKPTFEQYAKELGLNVDTFKKDSASTEVRDAVAQSRASGEAADVGGTPSFFFNGKRLQNPPGLEAFRAALDYYLSQSPVQTTSK